VVTNVAIFWDIALCSVSEQGIASIFRVNNQGSKKVLWCLCQYRVSRLYNTPLSPVVLGSQACPLNQPTGGGGAKYRSVRHKSHTHCPGNEVGTPLLMNYKRIHLFTTLSMCLTNNANNIVISRVSYGMGSGALGGANLFGNSEN
jgi:hypothetical protein